MMQPKVIKTEAEYEAALTRVAELMDAQPGSSEEEELELLAMLVEQYEQEHFPIAPPDPVSGLLFRIE
jgi:HTH-type transcriptional regulator/antitoxin HigA